MTAPSQQSPSHGAGRLSRSAVGRVSGAVSRWLGGSAALQATGRFLRGQLWAWPIIAAILFGGAGWWVHRAVDNAMRDQRAVDLNTMVDASVNAVRVWLGEQKTNVLLFAEDAELAPLVAELLPLGDGTDAAEQRLVQAPAQKTLRARLKRKLQFSGYVGYFVVAPNGVVVAADQDAAVGKALERYRKEIFDRGNAGETVVSKPFRSPLLLTDEKGEVRALLPTMFAIGPLRDKKEAPIAALGLRIRPEDQFTRILQVVRFGKSGETYAFDKDGLLLSQSRFDDDLRDRFERLSRVAQPEPDPAGRNMLEPEALGLAGRSRGCRRGPRFGCRIFVRRVPSGYDYSRFV